MSVVSRNGTTAYVGLPEREAAKLQDLWQRDEVGVELSVEVRAPVIVGVYPMRIARFVLDQATGMNGHVVGNGNGYHREPGALHEPMDEPAPQPRPSPIYDRGPEASSPE